MDEWKTKRSVRKIDAEGYFTDEFVDAVEVDEAEGRIASLEAELKKRDEEWIKVKRAWIQFANNNDSEYYYKAGIAFMKYDKLVQEPGRAKPEEDTGRVSPLSTKEARSYVASSEPLQTSGPDTPAPEKCIKGHTTLCDAVKWNKYKACIKCPFLTDPVSDEDVPEPHDLFIEPTLEPETPAPDPDDFMCDMKCAECPEVSHCQIKPKKAGDGNG